MLIGLVLFLGLAGFLKIQQIRWPDALVQLRGKELNVLVAKTPSHRFTGLGGRESLGEYNGMLFLFYTHRKHGIVMRDMKFPIDIVWLDRGRVVDVAAHIPLEPHTAEQDLRIYYPRKEANLVLELPAGWTVDHELKIGDRMEVLDE